MFSVVISIARFSWFARRECFLPPFSRLLFPPVNAFAGPSDSPSAQLPLNQGWMLQRCIYFVQCTNAQVKQMNCAHDSIRSSTRCRLLMGEIITPKNEGHCRAVLYVAPY
jgi:hypothetical protein